MGKIDVLLVDDDADIRFGTNLLLKTLGYEVTVAENGFEAIEELRKRHPDVVLMDIRMPVMDGLAALQEIRSGKDTCDIPVVIASASLGDQDESLSTGACYFIRKPYSSDCLESAIQSALRLRTRATVL